MKKGMTSPLQKAKTLRHNQTDAEHRLWHHLRGKRFDGVKFKRQKPIGPYIVDFVAVNRKLVIELDGGQHQERAAYDQERTRYLESLGYRVLRFWNNECLVEMEGVLGRIQDVLAEGDASCLHLNQNRSKPMNGQRFASVWDAIEDTPEEAENMKLRSALMMALKKEAAGTYLFERAVEQAKAAATGMSEAELNDLIDEAVQWARERCSHRGGSA